jgi:hypothetical protein
MPTYVETWDESKPAGSRDRSLGDDDIREFKRAIRERLAEDHEFSDDESGSSVIGYHSKCTLTLRGSDSTAVTDAYILYCKSDGTTDELFGIDESGNVIQFTDGGKLAVLGSEGWRSGDMLISSSTTTPTGWTDVSTTYDNKFIRITDGTPLTTGGSDTHDHGGSTGGTAITQAQLPNVNFTASVPFGSFQSSGGAGQSLWSMGDDNGTDVTFSSGGSGNTHDHSISSASNVPAYIELRMYQKD